MSGKLVLITGVTGHIGFHVLTYALDAGYHVRAAVRSEQKAKSILESGPLKSRKTASSHLTFTIVPDLTVTGAYDEAVKGVEYIIHIASPLASADMSPDLFQTVVIDPAVKGSLGILESAHMSPGIRRIVITSSTAAIGTFQDLLQGSDKIFTAESRAPTPDASGLHNPLQAYIVSKTAALNEAEKWIEQKKPVFDVIHLHPPYTFGRDQLQTSRQHLATKGSNQHVIKPVIGLAIPYAISNATVHVDDVARVHVDALSPNIPGNTSYILASNNTDTFIGSDFSKLTKIVGKHFPEAVASGVLPNNGNQPCFSFKLDVRKTEKTFGFTHLSFEQQVKDTISHYLELEAES